MALAPFELVITPLNYEKSERVRDYTDTLYQQLVDAGVDVILDDRPLRPGNKFADAELMGLPHRLVIGERGLDAGNLEYRDRRASENEDLPMVDIVNSLLSKLKVPA